jgi:hypothetical protein
MLYFVPVSDAPSQLTRKKRKPDPVLTQMKRASSGASQDDDMPMVTERRRKLRPRLPVENEEGSDGTQVDKEPLAGSRVRTGTRRRGAVVSTSRRSLIED